MSVDKRWRLICYDIREPKRYRKVFKILRGVGRSVQYSIFRARLDDREIEKLRWQLAQVMDTKDALLVVDLCARCSANVVSRNHVEGWTDEVPSFRILASPCEHDPTRVVDDEPARDGKLSKPEEKEPE